MLKVSTRILGIQQGSVLLFSDFQQDGPMWSGAGSREIRREVRFPVAYRDPPLVQVSMSMWDMDQATNPRADLSCELVGAGSFWMVFRTWGDTRIARVRADWTAFGPAPEEDDWILDD